MKTAAIKVFMKFLSKNFHKDPLNILKPNFIKVYEILVKQLKKETEIFRKSHLMLQNSLN